MSCDHTAITKMHVVWGKMQLLAPLPPCQIKRHTLVSPAYAFLCWTSAEVLRCHSFTAKGVKALLSVVTTTFR